MQLEECQGRIIVKLKRSYDPTIAAAAVIERAKQKFTSLICTHDLSYLGQVFLDFPEKDINFIKILDSDEFPEVVGGIFDEEIVVNLDDKEGPNKELGVEPAGPWKDEVGKMQAGPEFGRRSEDLEGNPISAEPQAGNFNNVTPEDIANNVAIAGDDVASLASQVDPFATANVIPFSRSQGFIYDAVMLSSSYGPKIGQRVTGYGDYPMFDKLFFCPGDYLAFYVEDASNANYKLCFSTTPEGIHNGGVEYTTNVTRSGTPGQTGAWVKLDFNFTTPLELYIYEENTIGASLTAEERASGVGQAVGTHSIKVSMFAKWHLARMTQMTNDLGYGSYSLTEEGENTDIYIIDSGVRGASRPTGSTGAALHPELYHPDYISDLNGATEQAAYRVYSLPGYYSGITSSTTGETNTNEDDQGHGTTCAILAAGRTFGVSRKSRIYACKLFNETGYETTTYLSRFASIVTAIKNHNDPTHANWKGSYRPAVVNGSFGVMRPSPTNPYISKNEPGYDYSISYSEVYDDYEDWLITYGNIIYVRSAGNGFVNAGYTGIAYNGYQGKFLAGVRSGGPKDNKYNMEIGEGSVNGKITVGATGFTNEFSAFSNYGTITTSAPGESIYCPIYQWGSTTPYNFLSSSYYQFTQGTSFSGPLVAGTVALWATKMGYLQSPTVRYEGKPLPQLAKEWIRRELDWDYTRSWFNGVSTNVTSPVSYEYGGGSVYTYPTNNMDEITLDGVNSYVQTSNASNIITFYLGSEYSRLNAKIGDVIQIRTPIGIISSDPIDGVWVSETDGGTDSPTAGYHMEGGLFNLTTNLSPWPGLFGSFPKAGTSGYVSNLTLSQQGSGYTIVPTVSFSGGGGAGAIATAEITLTGGAITSINVDQAGSGYSEAPTVVLTGDGDGATATANIALTGGGIDTITITNGGAGYNPLNLPAITFTCLLYTSPSPRDS